MSKKRLKWRKGTPTEPGWWFIWPDKEHYLTDQKGPRVKEVFYVRDGFGGRMLFINKYPNSERMLEAHLFSGRIAGPLDEPAE